MSLTGNREIVVRQVVLLMIFTVEANRPGTGREIGRTRGMYNLHGYDFEE